MRLAGKVAIVTGAASGIGEATAALFRDEGAHVIAADIAAAENVIAADAGSENDARRLIDTAVARHGRVDIFFANAGVSGGRSGPFVDRTVEEWDRVLDVNLRGAFLTFRAAARHMKARAEAGDRGGVLVGTASLAAIEGAARNEHYGASKGGIVSMIRALAVELARYGVRANSILPGWIETDMTARAVGDPKFAGNVLPRVPMRRWGTGSDFGGIAVYLMSSASSVHAGDTLVIDGGYALY